MSLLGIAIAIALAIRETRPVRAKKTFSGARKSNRQPDPQLVVERWNSNTKIGDSVTYVKSIIEGRIVDKVAGEAFVLGDEPVVELERVGVALLSKIEFFTRGT